MDFIDTNQLKYDQFPVIYKPSPLQPSVDTFIAEEGQSLADIIRQLKLPEIVWRYGIVKIGDHEIDRKYWERVKPKAGAYNLIRIGVRLAGGGEGGGGKNIFATIAAIALLVVVTAISGGALATLGLSTTLFAAGSTSAALAAAGVAVVGTLAINALTPPPASPQAEESEGATLASLGSASGGQNQLGQFEPIPFVTGTHRVTPPNLVPPWTEAVNDDQFINLIVGLNGAHKFSEIRINDTPVEDFDDVQVETRDVINDDTDLTLITQQVFENQVNTELAPQKVQDDNTDRLQDQTFVEQSYPEFQAARSRLNPDEIWITLLWSSLTHQETDGTTSDGGVPIRVRIRRKGQTTWINLPEFHVQRDRLEAFRGVIKLRFETPPTSVTRVDEDTSFPPWSYALYITDADNSESFDVDSYFTAVTDKNAINVASESGNAVVFLDPATFPKDTYDIQVKRGYGYRGATFSTTSYQYSGAVPFFFTHTAGTSPATIRVEQSKVPSTVSWQSLASVWSEYPLGEKGMSIIAVRAKNISVNSLSVLAQGYANIYDGVNWDSFEPTNNPAAWFRRLALGGQSVRAPFVQAQLDDNNLEEWYDFCGDERTNAAQFDGTNDYLLRGAGLTGATDSKLFTFSLWVNPFSLTSISDILNGVAGVTSRFNVSTNGSNLSITASNSVGTEILNVEGSNLVTDQWIHILGSFDLASTSNRHLYINNVSNLSTVTTYTDDTIDFTLDDWSVGGDTLGARLLNGSIAELWFNPGTYLDLSIQSNRQRFISTNNRPVNLGSDGSNPIAASPLVYLSGTIDTWATNKGTGEGFTTTGALVQDNVVDSGNCINRECNLYVQGVQSINDILRVTTGAGRAAARFSDKIGVVIERDRSDEIAIQTFTQRNTSGLSWRRAFPIIPDGFRTRYNDETNDYLPEETFVFRARTDENNVEAINYGGITRQALARDRAQLDFKQLTRRSIIYSFETDIENIYCTKGSLVKLIHDTLTRQNDASRLIGAELSSGQLSGFTTENQLRLNAGVSTDNFSDDTIGQQANNFSPIWDPDTTLNIVSSVVFDGTQAAQMDKTAGADDAFWSYTPSVVAPNVDVQVLLNVSTQTTIDQVGVGARVSGTDGSENGYILGLSSSDGTNRNELRITKFISGVSSSVAVSTFNWLLNTNYRLRFNLINSRLRSKVWLASESEPTAWNIDTSDGDITLGGAVGLTQSEVTTTTLIGQFDVTEVPACVLQFRNGTTLTAPINEVTQTSEITFLDNQNLPTYLTDRGAWTTSTSYARFDVVVNGGVAYEAIAANTADAANEPGVGVNWRLFWDRLLVDSLSAVGPYRSTDCRMLVFGIEPLDEFSARITLVDEAPPIPLESSDNCLVRAPDGTRVIVEF